MSDQPVQATHEEQHQLTAHGRWPHRWWHYPLMPVVILFRIRPSASARAWFVWGVSASLIHAALILLFFGLYDQLSEGVRAWLINWYPFIGAVITWLQVKSIGMRPPSEENWDKWDNRTSYIPISMIAIVIAVYVTKAIALHFSASASWLGLGPIVANLLPATIGEIYPSFLAAIFFALCDASMIDLQFMISRGLQRVTPR